MDKKELERLNTIACNEKKPSFKYGKYVVRSSYGILKAGECCGNQCMFCIFNKERGSTEILKKLEW